MLMLKQRCEKRAEHINLEMRSRNMESEVEDSELIELKNKNVGYICPNVSIYNCI